MKLIKSWLKEWVNPAVSTEVLAEQLTLAGLEVDSTTQLSADFSNVVIGLVTDTQQHPNADRLKCCKVDVGQKELLNIVCGGVNVRPNLKVAVAMVGAELPGNIQIKQSTIRGEPSQGMICSAKELGLENPQEPTKGIMELPEDAPIGEILQKYWNLPDEILEIELTPNRGDCLSILGLAREVALINNLELKEPAIFPTVTKSSASFPVQVEAPAACPVYCGRIIEGINNHAKTPVYIRERLSRSGIRTINPVVDVCNYVMLELGQPMHGFDLNLLQTGIQVRYSKPGEKILLLDNQEVELLEKTLVIADAKQPQAIAGIMGGFDSGVTETTQNIFLESAYFDPQVIRGAADRYKISSDSSYRFERGVDYQLQQKALERATALIVEIVGGEPGPMIEKIAKEFLPQAPFIVLHRDQIERLLGISIADEQVERILLQLGMKINKKNNDWHVVPPSYRFDILFEADLIEELARIHGYDKIPQTALQTQIKIVQQSEKHLSASRIKDFLMDRDYNEVITYSFVDEKLQQLLDPEQRAIELANPITNDMKVMRTNLLPGLLQTLLYNLNRQMSRIRIFETGLCFQQSANNDWLQTPRLGVLAAGSTFPEQWNLPQRGVDFFDVKGDVEALLQFTHRRNITWRRGSHPALHPGQSADIYLNEKRIGYCGLLHPSLVQQLDLNHAPVLLEADLLALEKIELPHFETLSKFPSVRRDLAIVLDQALPVAAIRERIIQHSGKLLRELTVFDLYQGQGIEAGKKSIALGLTFQDTSRTLVEDEINTIIQDVVALLEREFNAKLRA